MRPALKLLAPPKAKSPAFSRKKSRFSGKNRLKRVRLICCSSASTWAKSVLTVKSAVRFWVMPYFASMPTSAVRSFEAFEPFETFEAFAVRVAEAFEIAYGLNSMFFDPGGASRPMTVAARDMR